MQPVVYAGGASGVSIGLYVGVGILLLLLAIAALLLYKRGRRVLHRLALVTGLEKDDDLKKMGMDEGDFKVFAEDGEIPYSDYEKSCTPTVPQRPSTRPSYGHAPPSRPPPPARLFEEATTSHENI